MPEFAALLPELEDLLHETGRLAQTERQKMSRELKPDGSIVTNADHAVELMFRARLPLITPGANVWGEEFGYAREGEGGLWVVDPVDGTTNFAFGSPMWGVTAAYVRDARIVAGGIFLPDLGETYLASLGGGATRNGLPLHSLHPGPILAHELVSCSQYVFMATPGVRWPGKWRCAGSFVVDGAFVACGRFRGLVGYREKLYDIAASLLINAELGADIRFADGQPLSMQMLLEDREIGKAWVIFPRQSAFAVE